MQPMLEDPATPLEIRQNLFERLLNTIEASYGILNRRVNIIELLTRKDDNSHTAEEWARDVALIADLERNQKGFEEMLAQSPD